tara:strand:- start:1554 stop:2423 length:870 start_codon:yes stop_codon:yes gene_type:complete
MKVIIWGHYPLHSSTHGYIHDVYFKAFEYLGHDVQWVANDPNIYLQIEPGTVFFVEDSQKSHMPVRKDCKYITHHVDTKYFTDRGVPYENVLKLGNCIRSTTVFEKIEDLCYWDESTRTLYQTWGTDLLPHEIDENDIVPFDPSEKYIHYVGMMYEQGPYWIQYFAHCAEQEGKEVQLYTQSISHEENRRLIRNSYICPDFRSDWHLQCGYIPCRIQKNISYGKVQGTNSPFIKEAFGDHVVYGGTPETLYANLVQANRGGTVNMRDAMLFVKEKHTYINRINNILRFL